MLQKCRIIFYVCLVTLVAVLFSFASLYAESKKGKPHNTQSLVAPSRTTSAERTTRCAPLLNSLYNDLTSDHVSKVGHSIQNAASRVQRNNDYVLDAKSASHGINMPPEGNPISNTSDGIVILDNLENAIDRIQVVITNLHAANDRGCIK